MKITSRRRLARLAGLSLLALAVSLIGVQAVATANVHSGGTRASVASLAKRAQVPGLTLMAHGAHQGIVLSPAAGTASGVALGRGGFDRNHFAAPSGTQPASSGKQIASSSSSSRNAWIAGGSAAAVLLVVFAAWALVHGRPQSAQRVYAAYCAQHPEDQMCRVA